ncbi:iron chelate uptake ABC transporter family permease subunit [Microbacterium sp. No. 7]|uniref:iron chelate uptake ABC transporter family permease subunit n=1 Tax=Microbacterium sp. No. 7 TaxID=1714373 RepID=UPI0006CF36BC|nr:iron chelate uptake ABC transporter family permease subunit [Microbacterium sp. No. 7]ALJ19776.1 ABC transporter permease [Microbacterium sp. No. 7]
MTAQTIPATVAAPPRRHRSRRRWIGILLSAALLAALVLLSIAIGSAMLPLDVVWRAFADPDGSATQVTVTEARLGRTVLGVLVGVALGVSGALIQALTRNPLADPGILGVNAGAGFAIALAVAFLGVTSIHEYLPFAFAGAIAASAIVYLAAGTGRGSGSPVRLTLVGVAFAAVLTGFSHTLALIDVDTFNRMRFWGAGTITDRPAGTIEAILPAIVLGAVVAAFCVRPLNAIALGDDAARAVGLRVGLARAGVVVAVTLLCGAATAAAGPLLFVGLVVPHAVRWITGPDWVWVTAYSAVLAPVLVLASDILARLVVFPAELQVGVVLPLLGAPVLIALVRGRRARAL